MYTAQRPPSLSRSTLGHPTLQDARRLSALKGLMLMDTPTEAQFDRLTRLAARLTGSPVSLVSLVDGNRQWFKSIVGLPDPWASRRETPLSHSFCQHVVTGQKPLIISDSREVEFLKDNLAIPELNVIAYLGMPLTTNDGYTMGSLCVIDSQPRQWTEDDIAILQDLSATTISLIEMRGQLLSMNTTNDNKARSAMSQLAQIEAHRKDEAHFFNSLMRQVMQMAESNRPNTDILNFLKGVGI